MDWTAAQLRELKAALEIRIAGRRPDGGPRPFTTVLHVVVDGAPRIRSLRGPAVPWFEQLRRYDEGEIRWGDRAARVRVVRDASLDAEVDAAFRAKYGAAAAVHTITGEPAASTTLRIEPR